ncbi:MAG: winged helix-turn-helix transcriptional regulator [Nannocystis sp.]|nr:winged helix-turn-helix transcriptional regulator [Nannocystis sp.]
MGGKRAKSHGGGNAGKISRECAAFRLRVINRAVSRIYDEALRPHGLRIAQLNTLTLVVESGGITPHALSARMHMDASTVSRNVERMCHNGWLELGSLDDARSHAIYATAKGARLLKAATPAWEQAQAETEALLGAQVLNSLWKAVERIEDEGEA